MDLEVVRPTGLQLPPVPWRDPHTVSPKDLAQYIEQLELACRKNPNSADLRTCLGMAHAMNYDVYRSMDALEAAVALQPENFWAQLKFAELHYRLRALIVAEKETLKAMDLANNAWELSLARKMLQEIRRLMRDGTQKPEWTKSLGRPALMLTTMIVVFSLMVAFR